QDPACFSGVDDVITTGFHKSNGAIYDVKDRRFYLFGDAEAVGAAFAFHGLLSREEGGVEYEK
ncbi:MAG: hypothetical protein ABIJ04_04255, partial [Bacteroidota bacterium]